MRKFHLLLVVAIACSAVFLSCHKGNEYIPDTVTANVEGNVAYTEGLN